MAGWVSKQRRKKGQEGFTLIELLVVIIILGILAAVVVFAVGGVGDKGKASAKAIDLRTLRTAEEAYFANNSVYATEAELVAGGLLSEESSTHEVVVSEDKKAYYIGTRGGTLVVGETFTSNTVTNVASNTSGGAHAWWETMYNGLLTLDEKGRPTPELATEVPTVANGGITNNGATYTLKLRSGVIFHDGSTFDATDVKWTFEKLLLKLHSRTANMNTALGYDSTNCLASNIVIVDPLTVRFNFLTPYAPFIQQLNVTEAAMNSSTSTVVPAGTFTVGVAGCPSQAQGDSIKVGTGPFKFDSINTPQAGDGKVVRNPSYWRVGLPFLDGILMRPFTTDAPRFSALSSGAVDFVWDVPNPNVASLASNPAFKAVDTQSLGGGPNSVDTVIFNLKASLSPVANVANGTALDHPILGDIDVRMAISRAINRDEYLTTGRNGIGTVSKSPISSQILGTTTDVPLPTFSTAAADALLDANFWNGTPRVTVNGTPNTRVSLGHPSFPDGTPLTLRFLQPSGIFTDRVAVMKSNLAAVGINMVVTVAASPAAATTTVFTNRDFDLFILNYAAGFDPHIGVRRQYHTTAISTTGTPNNAAGYRNAGIVDANFDLAAQTIDPTARAGMYRNAVVQIVNDLPYAWMIETPNVRGFKSSCTGFRVWTGLFAEFASCAS